ncbi:MAG TPA: alpha/beta fold hydrolase [Pyrinomonadaceae bacterium]|nr:alpha/beta fold hydrolase [Pyrinomonadaceae bacterium]
MSIRLLKSSFALLVFLLIPGTGYSRSRETGFLDRTLILGSAIYRYQVYVPIDFSPSHKWPVILFLHGSGARGQDGLLETTTGLGDAIRRNRDRFDFIAVFPQCNGDNFWFGQMEILALKMLDRTIKEFNGDADRVYLTGMSMGGRGVWYFAARNPNKFAAIVPVCGGVSLPDDFILPREAEMIIRTANPYETIARRISRTPIWVFHGSDDTTVPVTESRKMVAALKAEKGSVRYTEYAGVAHQSWDKAYAEPELYSWLLSHRLSQIRLSNH